MLKYIIKRLLIQIPVLFGIMLILFTVFQMAPGTPLASFRANPNMTAAEIERLSDQLGINKPVHIQFIDYVSHVLRGNLGNSFRLRRPVAELITERMWNTFYIAFVSLILSLLIAVPMGVLSATKQYSVFDYGSTVFALAGISIPAFFFGLMLMRYFAVDLRWFPVSGMSTPGADYVFPMNFIDILRHSVLPATVLGLIGAAEFARYTRSSMLEVIKQDYIRTARAKGLKERVVVYRHALRNAMIPVITLLGFTLPVLFSGALITEIVFTWPGMGTLQYNAVLNRDYPLVMGVNLFLAILTLFGNLLADISYAFADPRIRYD